MLALRLKTFVGFFLHFSFCPFFVLHFSKAYINGWTRPKVRVGVQAPFFISSLCTFGLCVKFRSIRSQLSPLTQYIYLRQRTTPSTISQYVIECTQQQRQTSSSVSQQPRPPATTLTVTLTVTVTVTVTATVIHSYTIAPLTLLFE